MTRIGVAIMHHPSRAENIPELVSGCAPLEPTVVADPEPHGRPSPLRTAKRAWAAVDDDVTHHLVLQDDVRLSPGFAAQLHDVVSRRPGHAVALFSLWHSPHNSYLVRRAAVAGAAFVRLSPHEWTPTQGLVLPARQARALADYLAGFPDEVQDDDELVAVFCRERGLPIVATVPHLMDSGYEQTLVSGHYNGLRGTVVTPGRPWSADSWQAEYEPLPGPYAVELRGSTCLVRPFANDPVEHQYGWYWHDVAPLLGMTSETVLAAASTYLARQPARLVATMTEVWAAAYLLGADVAAMCDRSGLALREGGPLTSAALSSWLEAGLSADDRALGETLMRDCLHLATRAVDAGLGSQRYADVS